MSNGRCASRWSSSTVSIRTSRDSNVSGASSRQAARELRAEGELAVVFTGDRAIRSLNSRYRHKDSATDVLSFPGEGGEEGLGDVVISIPAAGRNARKLGRTVDGEIEILALHGLIHVLGSRPRDGRRGHGPPGGPSPATPAGKVMTLVSILLVTLLGALSVTLTTVEVAFHLQKRRRLGHLTHNPRAEIVNAYLLDPAALLMPLQIGTYTAHVGLTVVLSSVLFGVFGHWSTLVSFLVMMGYLFVFRLTVPYLLVRRNPERALLLLLPAFHRFAMALLPLVRPLRIRLGPPLPEAASTVPTVPEAPPVLDKDENRLVDAVARFEETPVREIMTPRPDMVARPATLSLADLRRVMAETRYSRIPLFGEGPDDIVGMVEVRDLVAFDGPPETQARVLARPVHLVPETKKIAALLKDMQGRHMSLAVVIDEYGGAAGLVTVEDIVEELVGEIKDEYDVEQEPLTVDEMGAVVASGRVGLGRLAEVLGVDLSHQEADTVGGLVTAVVGRIPRAGETAEYGGFAMEVLDAERRRVNRVRFRRLVTPEKEAAE